MIARPTGVHWSPNDFRCRPVAWVGGRQLGASGQQRAGKVQARWGHGVGSSRATGRVELLHLANPRREVLLMVGVLRRPECARRLVVQQA